MKDVKTDKDMNTAELFKKILDEIDPNGIPILYQHDFETPGSLAAETMNILRNHGACQIIFEDYWEVIGKLQEDLKKIITDLFFLNSNLEEFSYFFLSDPYSTKTITNSGIVCQAMTIILCNDVEAEPQKTNIFQRILNKIFKRPR